ncbi:MAG: FkbM family methyltransferase [Pyrinomonadaceae bacterium]|nr:FkbM family methyltransferase [Pyrinomonadaceae bacterium]
MSTTLRLWQLRFLEGIGVKSFRARSGLNQPFICHLGDFLGEHPFYNADCSRDEITIISAWCSQFDEPIILDVGGNVGFITTQVAQLLRDKNPRVFSFEPVPPTFRRLVESVRRLGLEDYVYPICSALSDAPKLARIWYAERASLFAQISDDRPTERVGNKSAWCSALTLDDVHAAISHMPTLIKVDVEGHEVKVFAGAKRLLSCAERPAILFELNPMTLNETGGRIGELNEMLGGYRFFYVNDFEGQRMRFGEPVAELESIQWVSNIFAVPQRPEAERLWSQAVGDAERILKSYRK